MNFKFHSLTQCITYLCIDVNFVLIIKQINTQIQYLMLKSAIFVCRKCLQFFQPIYYNNQFDSQLWLWIYLVLAEVSFDTQFMKKSPAESIKKIVGVFQDLLPNQHSQSSPIHSIMAGLAVLVCWQILKGSHDFLHTFSMALYHK